MRRLAVFLVFLLGLIGLGAAPGLAATTPAIMKAADVPLCAGVELTAPPNGAVLQSDYRVRFTWSGEPKGTASREWVSIRIDSDKNGDFSIAEGTHAKADRGAYKAFARGRPGIYTWFVIFHDAKGKVICMSKTRTYIVGEQNFASADTGGPTVTVTVSSKGRYVVHLMGFRGTDITTGYAGGAANWEKPGDTYVDAADAVGLHDWKALGYDGVDIWGNGDSNVIIGSDKNDKIYGLAGSDLINGGKGDDIINGGNEKCFVFCGDYIDGGAGNDVINGGDETCVAFCGDIIVGGDGSDTIHGGSGNDIITGNLPFNVDDGDADTGSGDAGLDFIGNQPGDTITQ